MRVKDFTTVSGKKYDGMMGRCYRETDGSYKNYGLKGIRVCSEWIRDINTFRTWLSTTLTAQDIPVEVFIANAGDYQLDRIDSNGHYTPANCRLLSRQANSRNKANVRTIFISAEGEEVTV